jgi:uncharacterized protein YbbC (DUF1343 family)
MKTFKKIILIQLIGFLFCHAAYNQTVETGLETLIRTNFQVLKGKNVGLITNPTGVDRYICY